MGTKDDKERGDHLDADALADLVATKNKSVKARELLKVAAKDRRRKRGPFSLRASARHSDEGEVLTLRNMAVALHHPESGGQYSSSPTLAGPTLITGILAGLAVAAGVYFAAPSLMSIDETYLIVASLVAGVVALIAERFFAHRRLDLQISGGNFALYRNGRKKPFAVGPRGGLELWVHGAENYRRVRFIFKMRSLFSGEVEHDIFFRPVASDDADIIGDFAKRNGLYK